jgi:hypothetical protein
VQRAVSTTLLHWLRILAALLILKVTITIILGYRDYFPPDFASDFLRGRQSYFAGAYQWAFYTHIVAGPITLLLGLFLVSEQFRRHAPRLHRAIGKAQITIVLFLLCPSGIWMAYYAATGAYAAAAFGALAIATGTCALFGWHNAVNLRFSVHRRWMWRCFLLLCSAVLLRLIGGLLTVTDIDVPWSYGAAAWLSWLMPLTAFELWEAGKRKLGRSGAVAEVYSPPSITALSSPAMEIIARR